LAPANGRSTALAPLAPSETFDGAKAMAPSELIDGAERLAPSETFDGAKLFSAHERQRAGSQ